MESVKAVVIKQKEKLTYKLLIEGRLCNSFSQFTVFKMLNYVHNKETKL
jgi:hypothetical protein